ncbi:hypothetical protein BAUCODRAFT_22392 [Baudoinia panamericana UAMH 10762]|uniref:Uncharacterized protein n=1 Tax=Baudoinia panamericana (strain UAMH 10762) TaxID=717646 RepID=M2NJ22_BAUPA|nr:uncharacterized protein BAUCODRAFT_22392 [Baudoinia panamericana UAMH 10762]EMC99105.1 hypothetical protein BAUCODRAFT_22392 [Baudoinia panamericana UAMH 10762]
MASLDVRVVSGHSLPTHPWWLDLHQTIITAYKRKDIQAFPLSWTRLPSNPAHGAEGLATELGPHGDIVVVFEDGKPIACSGVLPFRGENWMSGVDDRDSEAAVAKGEITKPTLEPQPKLIAHIKPEGGKRLIANYSIEETGNFWPKMGFTVPVGSGSVLKKGFTHTPGTEGLKEDLHFRMGAKVWG